MAGSFHFSTPRLTPLIKKLLVVLFSVFVAELIGQNWLGIPVFETLALDIGIGAKPWAMWKMLTYILVEPPDPASVARLLISLVFIWLILSPFEERYGQKRTLQLLIIIAMGSALVAWVPALWLHGRGMLFGSNGLTLGGIAALAMSVRRSEIMLFGMFRVRATHLLLLLIGYSVLVFLASQDVITLFSSLGAIASGVLFVAWFTRPRRPGRSQDKKKNGRVPHLRVVSTQEQKPPQWLN